MHPVEFTGLMSYFPPGNNSIAFPGNFASTVQSDVLAGYQYQQLDAFFSSTGGALCQDLPPQASHLMGSNNGSNSTSDEADEHQQSIIDERRHRRMISNRESARRSRMRKQKHLDELCSQVMRLRNENHSLLDKLNRVSESHNRVLKENAKLKEEASDLRQMLGEIQADFRCNHIREINPEIKDDPLDLE